MASFNQKATTLAQMWQACNQQLEGELEVLLRKHDRPIRVEKRFLTSKSHAMMFYIRVVLGTYVAKIEKEYWNYDSLQCTKRIFCNSLIFQCSKILSVYDFMTSLQVTYRGKSLGRGTVLGCHSKQNADKAPGYPSVISMGLLGSAWGIVHKMWTEPKKPDWNSMGPPLPTFCELWTT